MCGQTDRLANVLYVHYCYRFWSLKKITYCWISCVSHLHISTLYFRSIVSYSYCIQVFHCFTVKRIRQTEGTIWLTCVQCKLFIRS
jgi:hypothetical protein